MKPCYIQAYISAVTVDTITRMVKSTLFELFQITVLRKIAFSTYNT